VQTPRREKFGDVTAIQKPRNGNPWAWKEKMLQLTAFLAALISLCGGEYENACGASCGPIYGGLFLSS
jgi:hypothetical protein